MRRRSDTAVVLSVLWQADSARTAVVGAGILIRALLGAGLMVATGWTVHAVSDHSVGAGMWAAGTFAAALLAHAAVSYAVAVAEAGLSRRFVEVAEDALAAAGLAPPTISHLERPETAGRIAAAAEAARNNLYFWSLRSLGRVMTMRIGGIVSGCLLFAFHWWAPLVLFAAYGVLIALTSRWSQIDAAAEVSASAGVRRRADYVRGLLADPGAAKEIRLFGLAGWLDTRFADIWNRAMRTVWRQRRRAGFPVVGGVVLLVGAHVVVIVILARQALHGSVEIGAVAVYLQAILGMDQLARADYDNRGVIRAGRQLRELRRLRESLGESRPAPVRSGTGAAEVRLQGVTYRYPGQDRPVIDGLDLVVPAGQSLAVVGLNGAGKSTLMKLMTGLYEPDSGEVLVDGIPADPARDRAAAIFQTFGRYEISLRDNVTLGRSDMDDATVRRALDAAGADFGIDLDTTLSAAYAGGTDLSGGQWQRVALARTVAALERGAGLLILDEPTAALDIRAEVELFETFLRLTRDVTTVLVSHRLSSVRQVDRIVVVEHGAIVEDGNHADLVATGGRYAELFALQAARFDAHA
ncbi:MAG TPA: ABC transporter ATP-binding protein [Mycobacteriales bacterium]|nr:ABC transporter ATP-binding protein [Mycobacteriales bacterium]